VAHHPFRVLFPCHEIDGYTRKVLVKISATCLPIGRSVANILQIVREDSDNGIVNCLQKKRQEPLFGNRDIPLMLIIIIAQRLP